MKINSKFKRNQKEETIETYSGLVEDEPIERVDEAEENRQYFAQLKQLAVDINNKNIDNVNMSILSMGMTGDYMIAVEEGATCIRVGTGIFGERQYQVK